MKTKAPVKLVLTFSKKVGKDKAPENKRNPDAQSNHSKDSQTFKFSQYNDRLDEEPIKPTEKTFNTSEVPIKATEDIVIPPVDDVPPTTTLKK